MKVLIIGSKGFIGSHVLNHFRSQGFYALGCDVVTDYEDPDYIQIDATNSDYHFIFEQHAFDVCVNCSGAASVPLSLEFPLKDFYLNTLNVFKILDAIRIHQPACKFVNLSSAAVYGNPAQLPIKENFPYQPLSPYGIHKMQAEQICDEFYQMYQIPTCSLRIFSAYGEGLKKQLLWDMYQKFANNEVVELFGTGNESRDFIHVSDITRVVQLVIEKCSFKSNKINVANGQEFTIKQVAETFKEGLASSKAITFNNIVKSGDPLNWRADVSVLTALGYTPKMSIETGIKSYIQWVKGL